MFFNHSVLREETPGGGGGGGTPPIPPAGTPPIPPAGGAGTPPIPAAAVPFYKGLYGDDGKIDKTALDRLPDHLKSHKDWLAKYDTIDAILQGGANAHKMAVGKLGPLQGNETPEVLAERSQMLDTMLNVPKEAKDYGLTRELVAKDLPEQFWDQKGADAFAGLAKKHHLSPDAVKDIMALQVGLTKASIETGRVGETDYYTAQQKLFETEVQKLGMDLEKANDLAARGAGTLGIDVKGGYFKSAEARLAAIRMTKLVSESKLINGESTEPSKDDPIEQARDIARNPQNPLYKAYHDPVNPDHQRAKDKWNELYRMAKPR